MCQKWYVFNLDKMEELGFYDDLKMGDWFFTSCTTRIVQELSPGLKLRDIDPRVPPSRSWAGDRIICLGDFSRLDDLPEGLFSAEEVKKLFVPEKVQGHVDSDDSEDFFDETIVERLTSCTRDMELPHYYKDYSHFVLRNLSKKEYIRGGPSTPALYEKYDGRFPDIGQKFFILICWSSNPTVDMKLPDGVDLSRGRWAGDRFDLVLLREVEDELKNNDWKDVSEEVEETLSRIRSANAF